MTSPLSKKLSEMAEKHGKIHPYPRDAWAEKSYCEGFKAALELPEIKQLVEALEKISEEKKFVSCPDGVRGIRTEFTDGAWSAREALSKFRTFTKEGT